MGYQPINVIDVRCWGKRVGALALDPSGGYFAFEYYPEFKRSGIELAPLMLPLSRAGIAVFPNLPENTYHRLPPLIADSLPDDFGNSLIDAWMAKNNIARSSFSVLDRLAYIGKRGMGALEYHPMIRRGRAAKSTAVEMNELVSAARKAITVNLREAKPDDVDSELAQLIEVGTSAGGARAKAVVGFNTQDESFISGQFDVPAGYEHWIIKFDTEGGRNSDRVKQYGRIEYAYYLMACACGINMSPSRLYKIGGKAHFMTKRFDRGEGNARHHVQTLCAMKGMDYNALRVHDYAQLFATVSDLNLEHNTLDELFRRMVFNVALSNNDDHTKNHSFILREGEGWELSPAYDVTHARNLASHAWTKSHIMGIGGVFSDITREDILRFGDPFPIKNPKQIIEKVVDVAQSWSEFARKAELSTSEIERVGKNINYCVRLLK
jgi:serine/threonine-protein kinase HipA